MYDPSCDPDYDFDDLDDWRKTDLWDDVPEQIYVAEMEREGEAA